MSNGLLIPGIVAILTVLALSYGFIDTIFKTAKRDRRDKQGNPMTPINPSAALQGSGSPSEAEERASFEKWYAALRAYEIQVDTPIEWLAWQARASLDTSASRTEPSEPWREKLAEQCGKTLALSDLASALIAKLDAVKPYINSMHAMEQNRGIRYNGPTYGVELEALRAALRSLPPEVES